MVLSRSSLFFWLLASLTIGLACGYLFSSKFCSITIGKRVEKISTLNQSLRKLFSLRTFYNFENSQMQDASNYNQDFIKTHLAQANQQIGALIGAYYDTQATRKISKFLEEESNPEQFATFLSELNPVWSSSIETIKENLTTSSELSTKIQESLTSKNSENALNLFEKKLDIELAFADELDKGIAQQFPHKF